MKRCMKKVITPVLLILCLMLTLAQSAFASEAKLFTTTGVNLRSEASTNAGVIRTVGEGVGVEVLSHDPAGWSRVRVNGSVGFIRSDFLAVPSGTSGVNFKTTDGVNLRKGPSTNDDIIRAVGVGNVLEMITHDPAGWSKVKAGDSEGYIRSDFLALPIQGTQQTLSSSGQSSAQQVNYYRTAGNVRFRSGPSTDHSIISTLRTGTRVPVTEYKPDGWSTVRIDGKVGYIRSDLLTADKIELITTSQVRTYIKAGNDIHVLDLRTGITYNIRAFSVGGHADVEPITKADTDAISRSRNGVWSWAARPVWVTVGGRTFAASIHGMPHAGSTIRDNGMDGHLCLHFAETVTNNKSYQQDLRNAVAEAWRLAQR